MPNASFLSRAIAFCALATLCVCAAVLTRADDQPPCNYPPASAVGPDGWINLFNGKDLTGWKLSDTQQSKVHVEDGKIVMCGPHSHLFTDWQFKDFEFEAEVMTKPRANSGIYFHTHYQSHGFPNTGYESQVDCTHRDTVRTGSLYNVVRLYETPAKDNEWWTQSISVKGKRIIVRINKKVVIDYTEPEGVTGGRKLSCGSFALQAHDPTSTTYFRNIRVKPL